MRRCMAILLFSVVSFPFLTVADVPGLFSYQGILKDSEGQPVEDDVYAIQFRIYDADTEGSVLWESTGFIPIQTNDGLFAHVLGSTNPLPDSLSRYTDLWAGITVDLDEELIPRTQLLSVPFSINAQYSDTTGTSLDKTIDASELTGGTLGVERFSAHDDLASEDKIGEASDQVAAGDHMHTGGSFSGTIYRYEDNSTVIENVPPAITLKTIDIPPGQVSDFFRVSFPVKGEFFGGTGTIKVIIILNGQWLVNPIEYPTSGPNTRYNMCLITGLRLEDNEWSISYRFFGDFPNEHQHLETISLDISSGLTLELYASYSSNPTGRVTLGNLIVEYDVD